MKTDKKFLERRVWTVRNLDGTTCGHCHSSLKEARRCLTRGKQMRSLQCRTSKESSFRAITFREMEEVCRELGILSEALA